MLQYHETSTNQHIINYQPIKPCNNYYYLTPHPQTPHPWTPEIRRRRRGAPRSELQKAGLSDDIKNPPNAHKLKNLRVSSRIPDVLWENSALRALTVERIKGSAYDRARGLARAPGGSRHSECDISVAVIHECSYTRILFDMTNYIWWLDFMLASPPFR